MRRPALFGIGLALIGTQLLAAEPATPVAPRAVDARTKSTTPYKPQPTRTVADLAGFRATPMPDRTPFGGVTRYPREKATGFFRTQRIDGRWWLIDPQGCRTIDVGVAATNVSKMSPVAQKAFDERFGTPEKWAAATRQLLRDNGFDGTGSWSDDDGLRAGTDRPLVHTRIWSFMGRYGGKRGGTTQEPGHTGYPNKCIFAFDPKFEQFADTFAAGLVQYKDDPYLLGYFTDNELPFPLDSLDRYLSLPDTDPGRTAAEAFVTKGRIKRDALTDADRQAWTAVVAERYFSVVHAAIRKYDPNHLILGPRFHSTDHRNEALLRTAGKYIDIVGYNSYGVWTPKDGFVDRLSGFTGCPILISEFYAKAEDSGLANTDGGGWLVKTQADRAAYYENYTLALIESRVAVGWHWFKYQDNDPLISAGVNPNDANKGILTRDFKPYPTLLTAMKRLNDSRYALADYFDSTAKR